MSRIGKQPITISDAIKVEQADGMITVTGPKGSLQTAQLSDVTVSTEDNVISVTRSNDEKIARSQHGLMRALVQNMVTGVTEGFKKQLEVNGVGFKVAVSGKKLTLALGFSHPVEVTIPEDIDIAVEGNVITVSGIDKQAVGQMAADIRALKKPEPYKGKGIKYIDEQIIRKAGKTAGGD